MKPSLPDTESQALLQEIRQLIDDSRSRLAATVNSALTLLYWNIGRRIHTEVLKGERAEYGEQIIATLAKQLETSYGRGFSSKNLRHMLRFAESFPDANIVSTLSRQLAWSHFLELIYLKDPLQRDFYTRELENFLLELGAGFTFVARQKRLQIDNDDFYIDLLFYNRRLKRLVAIDLKLGDFKAADKGQMELYLRWLAKHEQEPGEASPLGIILCSGKKQEQIELLELDQTGIHVAEYLTELPSKAILQQKLHEAIANSRQRLDNLDGSEA